MSDAKSPSDLSMDEILAAIRRIIADDEQSGTNASAAGAGAGGSAAGTAAGGSGSSGPPNAPPGGSEGRAGASEDVLELTEALNEDGTVRRLAPIGGSAPYTAGASHEPPPVTVAEDAEKEPPMPPEPEPARREPTGPSPSPSPSIAATAPEDRLVSEVTSLAAAAAFARVASTPRAQRETPMVADRPLDDIVQELLRPLLQTWLDENLPQIVERLVQAEIARIGRSGTG